MTVLIEAAMATLALMIVVIAELSVRQITRRWKERRKEQTK